MGVRSRTAAARADPVPVDLDEYGIEMPDTLDAGAVLEVRNGGFEEHDLEVRPRGSDSVTVELARPLDPGEVRRMTLDLEPGAYKVICTVSNHESRGMFTGLVVR